MITVTDRILGLWRFIRFVLKRWDEDRCPQIAGSLAFTTLLAIVPVFAIVVALLSSAPFFEQLLVQIKIFLLINLVPEIAGRIITVYMEEFARNAVRLTWMGVAVLFVSSVATMMLVERQIHAIWRDPPSRPLWLAILVYTILLLVGPLLIAISVSVTTYLMSLSVAVDASERTHGFLLQAAPTVVSTIAFMLLYKLVPHRRVYWRHAVVGAVTASVFFEGAKELFAIYVRNVPGYNVLYGAFVSIPFFLVWIYVSWLVVLFGAELTAALGNWKPRRQESGDRSQGDQVGAQEGET
jgi:membrane protein